MSREHGAADIAIIGMAGRFPGAPSVGALWENLAAGRETLSRLTEAELRDNGVPEELLRDSAYVPVKGLVDDAEQFDNEFFGYSPREAALMDPQIRWMHECAWSALEDAGYDPYRYRKRIGIYAGAGSNPHWHAQALLSAQGAAADFVADKDYLCARIAHRLDLKGPAVLVHTACSTSLVAVHLACRALLTGDCEMALAGGASLKVPQKVGYLYQEGMIASADGHCRSFDARATGTVPGEGFGLVVLKPFARAVQDGDHVYAVIKGSAINNDGRDKLSFTAPSVAGQVDVIRRAHRLAKVAPHTIGMVEAHGTGTLIGDPIEIESLRLALQSERVGFCALTSIKPNIGHLDHAAGIAGLIKAVLCLRHQQLPATLHFSEPNPELKLEGSPFYVTRALAPWPAPDATPRRAAVTSLGVGGTNAHVVLEEVEAPSRASSADADWSLFLTSARSASSLRAAHSNLAAHLAQHTSSPASVAYTLQAGRAHFEERHAFLSNDHELTRRVFSGDDELPRRQGLGFGAAKDARTGVAFLFPGQGVQYLGMTRGLYDGLPPFRAELDRCFEALRAHSKLDFKAALFASSDHEQLFRTELAQPLLFAVQHALARYLELIGVRASALIGHSVGEISAACVSGALGLHDACALVCARGRLMQALPPGKMLHVRLEPGALSGYLRPGVDIAALNSPSGTVVSGPPGAVEQLMERLQADGVGHKLLHASHAFHSRMMEPIGPELAAVVSGLEFRADGAPCISNVTGTWAELPHMATPAYWVEHALGTVRFSAGLRALLQDTDCELVEIGPGASLTRLARGHDDARGKRAVALTRDAGAKESDRYCLQLALGRLWLRGADIDWEASQLVPPQRTPLPGYVFQRRTFSFASQAPLLNSATTIERQVLRPVASDAPVDNSLSTTQRVARIFAEALGLPEVDPERDFFELGGDSLTAMDVIAQIHRTLGARLALSKFFDQASARGVAANVDSSERSTYSVIQPTTKSNDFRLSSAQRRLYIVHQTESDNVGYNESLHTIIDGALDRRRLESSFESLIARHESLRTSFLVQGEGLVQRVHEATAFSIEHYRAHEKDLERLIDNIIRPFNLGNAPLFRVALVELAPSRHLMVWDFHHIIMDGVSMGVLYRELIELYAARPLEPAPKLHYKDYAEWQHDPQQLSVLARQEAYWLSVFRDHPAHPLNLPTDYVRPRFRSFRGDSLTTEIAGEDLSALRAALQREGVSLFMLLIGVYYVLLAKLSGNDDIRIGTIVAGRRHAALRKLVGVFVNTLVLRARLRGDLSFSGFLTEVKGICLEAFENQEYPFEDLVERLGLERDTSRNSLFDVAFVLQNMEKGRDEPDVMGETLLSPYRHAKKVAKFDLTLTAIEGPSAIQLTWDYSTNLFSARTIRDLARAYESVLVSVVRDASRSLRNIDLGASVHAAAKPDLTDLASWSL
jgi:acyl transferase domain-containing protein